MAVIFLLGYQALWYAMVNVQGVDYRYSLLNGAVFAGIALKCQEQKKENTDETGLNKKKRKISKKFACAWILVGCIGLLVVMVSYFKENYVQVSDELSGKKVVCLGDSIWGLVQDDTGIASLLEKMTGATVVNCAIPGTTASKTETESENDVSSLALCQIVRRLQADEGNTISKIESSLEDAEYLILAYGLNDYFYGNEAISNGTDDLSTYEGALRSAIEYIRKEYPDIRIVLIGQTYCQLYSYGVVEEDSDTRDFGGGVGMDYVKAAESLSKEYDLLFINMYQQIPMDVWSGIRYLEDAIHLNELGRKKYAKVVSEYLLNDYKERNAQ